MKNFECNVIKLGEGYFLYLILYKLIVYSCVILVKLYINVWGILLVFCIWECFEDFIYYIYCDR